MSPAVRDLLRNQRDLLLFKPVKPDLTNYWSLYFGWGLLVTWIAGIGRYWDHPNADLWQYPGLGSVAYVFVLAFLIWIFTVPLKPEHWSYGKVLIFVMLTSPPAWLYAIPVEKFLSMRNAQSANAWFLAAVAAWRVALLLLFLRRGGGLTWPAVIVAGLLPLVLIVTGLTALNLEKAVFEIMGGIRNQTPHDVSYVFLIVITTFSVVISPVLLIIWLVQVGRARRSP